MKSEIRIALLATFCLIGCSGSDEQGEIPDTGAVGDVVLPDAADTEQLPDSTPDTTTDAAVDTGADLGLDVVDASTPDATSELCGNGRLDEGEACDGEFLGGATCADLGFESGALSCTEACTRDVSGCSSNPGPLCGDGVAEGDEACDGDDLAGLGCASIGGFGDGLLCADTCTPLAGGCRTEAVCGDGFIDGDEECDDSNTDADDGCSSECLIEDCHAGIRLQWYEDLDGDGAGSGEPVAACAAPGPRSVNVGGDCDDADPSRFPGNPERCDGQDNDCDDEIDETALRVGEVCESGLGGVCSSAFLACSEGELACVAVQSASAERCDGIDNDCDGEVDNGVDGLPLARTCYPGDSALLGVGACTAGVQTCDAAAWASCVGAVLPTEERCNGIDDDCDGEIDEGIENSTWYRDFDQDGFGDAAAESVTVEACAAPEGYVDNADDCDDRDDLIHPDADEVCDGFDNNCDTVIDEDAVDVGDACETGRQGVCGRGRIECISAERTCVATRFAAPETCNGQDDDCDGDVDEDTAGQPLQRACYGADPVTVGIGACTEGVETCEAGVWSTCTGEILPSLESCDGIDNDCDGQVDEDAVDRAWYADNDDDGFGTGAAVLACQAPAPTGWVLQSGDCLDSDETVRPGAEEIVNGRDDDCDGRIDDGSVAFDDDNDGFCEEGPCVGGLPDGDCDDSSGNIFPGAPELADGRDNDCDGEIDNRTPSLDDDGDGYCEIAPCVTGALGGGDCDDADPAAYPGAPELDNGRDDNCNGIIDDRRAWVGGAPSAPSSWAVAANWVPVGVPGTNDDVYIPVRPDAPRLVGNVTVTSLRIDDGATLELSGFTLTVREDLHAGNTITGAGTVVMNGDAALLQGTVPDLTITGNVALAGNTRVTGNLTLANASSLEVGGQSLDIGGGLQANLRNGAGLRMLDDADLVRVGGRAVFNLETTTSAVGVDALRRGVLELAGGLTQTDNGVPVGVWAFAPTGTLVRFVGANLQTVTMETPGLTGSRFADVAVADGARVQFDTRVYLDSIDLEGDASVTGPALHFTDQLPEITAGYLVDETHVAVDMTLDDAFTGYAPALLVVDEDATLDVTVVGSVATDVVADGTLHTGAAPFALDGGLVVGPIGLVKVGAGGLTVSSTLDVGGTLELNSGSATVVGTIAVSGTVDIGDGTLQAGSGLEVVTSGSVSLDTGLLDVNGLLRISGARGHVSVGAGLVVADELQVVHHQTTPSGMLMNGPGEVVVEGDASFSSGTTGLDTASNFTAGEMRLRGNLRVLRTCSACDRNLVMTGTRLVLDGDEAQTVDFAVAGAASNRLADVEFANPAGVVAASDIWITGQALLAAGTLNASNIYLTRWLPEIIDGTAWNVDITHVAGEVTALPSDVDVPMLQVDSTGTLTLAETTRLRGPLTVAGTLSQRGHSLHTDEPVTVTGLWLVEAGQWTAAEPVLISGASGGVLVGGGEIEMPSLRFAPSPGNTRGLVMTQAADRVTINGPWTVNEQAFYGGSTESTLMAGELRVRGNIVQTGATGSSGRSLVMGGTRLLLDGEQLQTVSLASNGAASSRFDDVVVSNPAGVTFASASWITGRLTVDAGASCTGNELVVTSALPRINGDFAVARLRVNSAALTPDEPKLDVPLLIVDAGSSIVLNADWEIRGNLEAVGSVAVDGHALTVSGDLSVAGGAIELDAGELEVAGATTLSGDSGAIFLSGGTATFSTYRQNLSATNSQGLVMRDSADRVFVSGTFHSAEVAFYSGTTENSFAAGELHLRGNLVQTAATGSNNRGFMTSGTAIHFDGTGAQTVTMAGNSTTTSHLGDVVITTPGGVVFGSTVWVDGMLSVAAGSALSGTDAVFTRHLPRVLGTWGMSRVSVAGSNFVVDLAALDVPILQVRDGATLRLEAPFALSGTIDVRGTVVLAGHDMEVGGNVEITSGSVDLGGATVDIGNDLLINGSAASLSLQGGQALVTRDATITLYDGSSGVLMNQASDALTVGRDFSVRVANLTGGTTEGRFTAGTLTVGGDISASDGISNTGRTIVLTGTRLVLNGTTNIQLGGNGPALSRFAAVDVEAGATVTLGSNVYTTGDWSVAGALTVPNSRTLTTPGTVTLQATGSLTLQGSIAAGTCTNDGGTITGSGSGCPTP